MNKGKQYGMRSKAILRLSLPLCLASFGLLGFDSVALAEEEESIPLATRGKLGLGGVRLIRFSENVHNFRNFGDGNPLI